MLVDKYIRIINQNANQCQWTPTRANGRQHVPINANGRQSMPTGINEQQLVLIRVQTLKFTSKIKLADKKSIESNKYYIL